MSKGRGSGLFLNMKIFRWLMMALSAINVIVVAVAVFRDGAHWIHLIPGYWSLVLILLFITRPWRFRECSSGRVLCEGMVMPWRIARDYRRHQKLVRSVELAVVNSQLPSEALKPFLELDMNLMNNDFLLIVLDFVSEKPNPSVS